MSTEFDALRTFILPEALEMPAAVDAVILTLNQLADEELGTRVSGPSTSSAAAGSTSAKLSEKMIYGFHGGGRSGMAGRMPNITITAGFFAGN